MTSRPFSFFAASLAALLIGACSREPGYSQASPEAAIATARQMVKNGDAKLLVKLVYSDDENMRKCLNRLGHALGRLQELALELEHAFPEDVRKLKEDARKQAGGGLGGLAQVFAGGGSQLRENTRSNAPGGAADPASGALTRLFVSPYQVLEEEGANLSAIKLDDKTYSVLYKNAPIVPGVPLLIRLDSRDGRWYFVLPTDLPVLNGYFFKSPEAWQTYTGLVATLDNIVKDLIEDVKSHKVTSLNETAHAAGEKAFTSLPFALVALDRLTAAERKKAGLSAKADLFGSK